MAVNEFSDQTDVLGLFSASPEIYKYFTIEEDLITNDITEADTDVIFTLSLANVKHF